VDGVSPQSDDGGEGKGSADRVVEFLLEKLSGLSGSSSTFDNLGIPERARESYASARERFERGLRETEARMQITQQEEVAPTGQAVSSPRIAVSSSTMQLLHSALPPLRPLGVRRLEEAVASHIRSLQEEEEEEGDGPSVPLLLPVRAISALREQALSKLRSKAGELLENIKNEEETGVSLLTSDSVGWRRKKKPPGGEAPEDSGGEEMGKPTRDELTETGAAGGDGSSKLRDDYRWESKQEPYLLPAGSLRDLLSLPASLSQEETVEERANRQLHLLDPDVAIAKAARPAYRLLRDALDEWKRPKIEKEEREKREKEETERLKKEREKDAAVRALEQTAAVSFVETTARRILSDPPNPGVPGRILNPSQFIHFHVLGIDLSEADEAAVTSQHRRLARLLHPDKVLVPSSSPASPSPSPTGKKDMRERATEAFKQIGVSRAEALRLLKDKHKWSTMGSKNIRRDTLINCPFSFSKQQQQQQQQQQNGQGGPRKGDGHKTQGRPSPKTSEGGGVHGGFQSRAAQPNGSAFGSNPFGFSSTAAAASADFDRVKQAMASSRDAASSMKSRGRSPRPAPRRPHPSGSGPPNPPHENSAESSKKRRREEGGGLQGSGPPPNGTSKDQVPVFGTPRAPFYGGPAPVPNFQPTKKKLSKWPDHDRQRVAAREAAASHAASVAASEAAHKLVRERESLIPVMIKVMPDEENPFFVNLSLCRKSLTHVAASLTQSRTPQSWGDLTGTEMTGPQVYVRVVVSYPFIKGQFDDKLYGETSTTLPRSDQVQSERLVHVPHIPACADGVAPMTVRQAVYTPKYTADGEYEVAVGLQAFKKTGGAGGDPDKRLTSRVRYYPCILRFPSREQVERLKDDHAKTAVEKLRALDGAGRQSGPVPVQGGSAQQQLWQILGSNVLE